MASTHIGEEPAGVKLGDEQRWAAVRAHIAKGDRASDKAEQHYVAAGQYLISLKAEHTGSWAEWETLVKEKAGIGKSRAADLMRIAAGTKTVAQIAAASTARSKKHRALSPLRNGETKPKPVAGTEAAGLPIIIANAPVENTPAKNTTTAKAPPAENTPKKPVAPPVAVPTELITKRMTGSLLTKDAGLDVIRHRNGFREKIICFVDRLMQVDDVGLARELLYIIVNTNADCRNYLAQALADGIGYAEAAKGGTNGAQGRNAGTNNFDPPTAPVAASDPGPIPECLLRKPKAAAIDGVTP